MAAISKQTGATVAPIWPAKAIIKPAKAAEAVANGQTAYLATTGKYGLADTDAAGKQQFRGIFLEPAGANQGTSILERGAVGGYDLSGLAYGALVYASDTAGGLDSTAGTMTVAVGRVVPMSDDDLTKVLDVFVNPLTTWS